MNVKCQFFRFVTYVCRIPDWKKGQIGVKNILKLHLDPRIRIVQDGPIDIPQRLSLQHKLLIKLTHLQTHLGDCNSRMDLVLDLVLRDGLDDVAEHM